MRHLILVLMIALLPLRGWVGDVMAEEMVKDALVQTSAAHAHTDIGGHMAGPAMHADCAGHDGHDGQHGDDDNDHCAHCAACDICHTMALAGTIEALAAEPAVVAPPAILVSEASAERAPGFKPPIS